MITNINKWWHCFVEWEQENGTMALSVIPWYVLLWGVFGDTKDFKWSWVPSWKVKVGN